LSSAFYPNKRLLAQSSRTLVCQDHPAAHSPRNLYRRQALGSGHPRLHPDQYPQSKAFCLDGYCRPDLCQNYQYFINELLLQNTSSFALCRPNSPCCANAALPWMYLGIHQSVTYFPDLVTTSGERIFNACWRWKECRGVMRVFSLLAASVALGLSSCSKEPHISGA